MSRIIKATPNGWQSLKIGDIATVSNEKYSPTDERELFYIGLEHIEKNTGRLTSKVGIEKIMTLKNRFSKRDILYGKLRPNLNKVYLSNYSGVCSTDILVLKISDKCFAKYLYSIMLSTDFVNDMSENTSGVNLPRVSTKYIMNYQIALPSKDIQKQIVLKIEELFSDIDKGIEDLKIAQQQLKTYRQSVLKRAFEGKLTNENLKEGELPKSWKMVQIKDVALTYGGYAFKSGKFKSHGKYQVLRMGNVRPGIVRYDESPVFIDDVDQSVLNRSLLKIDDVIITQTGTRKKRDYGFTTLISKNNLLLNQRIASIRFSNEYMPKFFLYYSWTDLFKDQFFANETGNVGQGNVGMKAVTESLIPNPPFDEQHLIVQEIESRLSVADKMEESINESLKQAEALRQSILKKAFSGELLKEVVQEKVYKPKNQYFFQMQIIGKVASISKKNNIEHGEMTIAKYTYLADKLFGIPTGFEFNRWHLGPYPPAIKKVVNNKQYFQRSGNHIEVVNESTLFKSPNDYTALIDDAVSSLVGIFSKYKTPAERAHKTELLATVCKVIEDIKTTDLMLVRASMKEWKIDLKTSSFKNKAEKFSEEETNSCIEFIVGEGWDDKLI